MKHYEVVFLVHPDQSEQIAGMVDKYKALISENKGSIHRYEDWGRMPLAYPIDKVHKAHYILMNIEVEPKIIEELSNLFRFNDAIIRDIILTKKHAITERSVMLKNKEKERDYSPKDRSAA